MNKYTYHIHWKGQPQPEATSFTTLTASLISAMGTADDSEPYSIVKIGRKGWPHEYQTVYQMNGGV